MSSTDTNISSPEQARKWNGAALLRQFSDLLEQPRVIYAVLAVILVIAAYVRFNGLNWDEGHHQHPDERFLSTVTNDLQWPVSFKDYFNPDVSTLSPYSNPNMGLYVYGMLPVYIVKWVAIHLDKNNYDAITLVGRRISGLFDLGSILILYLIGKKLYGRKIGLLAAALLSFSVLNIQLSHFYAVDTFANLFILATIYFLLRAHESGRWFDYATTGLMFGLGLASKLSVFTLLVPILVMAGYDLYRRIREGDPRTAIEFILTRTLTIFAVAFLTFRILHPIAFTGPGFWNWSLNPKWLEDVIEQQKITAGQTDLPWVQQWTGRSIAFPLYNILFWGMGLPLGLASFAGLLLAAYELIRYRRIEHLIPVAYVGATFIYHSLTFIRFMRYFLPIYPFLILLGSYFVFWLWGQAVATVQLTDSGEDVAQPSTAQRGRKVRRVLTNRYVIGALVVLIVVGTFLYSLAFNSIYDRPNARIAASRWIQQNIAAGSTLANEHWDDWLPIGGVDGITSYGDTGLFQSVEMKNYEDDTPDKLNSMVDNLTQADYIILSSNRLYDSIPRLPIRYPMTSRYYKLLFSGKLGYERVKEFNSYPSLFGIQIPDQAAEESFSVYDHPRVQIFKKTAAFNPDQVRRLLGQGIVWENVLHLTPLELTKSPNQLMLTGDEQTRYKLAAINSSTEINENSWGSRNPILAWVLILELVGVLALPLILITFSRLTDRGYIFSKPVGLLIIAWGSWMIASLQIIPFTRWLILACALIFALVSFFLVRKRWKELKLFIATNWRLLVAEEIGFWLFFAFLLFIRAHNPDLWHPGMGGEKPMDLAYLTAIAHTPYFPSYDPWFTGGYINYYYFGFVLVAALIHLTGIVPYIAYNVAVPTFFAMTAMGAAAVAINFTATRQASLKRLLITALCGALFVAVIGNLAQVKLIYDGIRNLSTIPFSADESIIMKVAQFTDGLGQWMAQHQLPSIRTEWWYWNATRVIPPAAGEAGPINEMPFFTFLFGDLHAHMMALPFTLLVLALTLNLLRSPTEEAGPWWRDPAEIISLFLLALTTGALWTINTWDFPTYILLVAAALTLRAYARHRRFDFNAIWTIALQFILVVFGSRLLFQPFHSNYAGTNFGAELWKGSQTPLSAYLMIHGFFLFVIGFYLTGEFFNGHGHNSVVRVVRLKLRYWRDQARLKTLFDRLTLPQPSHQLVMDISSVALVISILVLLINPVIGLALFLTLLSALLLLGGRPNPIRQFLLCMIGLGLILTAMVEVVVLKGDISRMNTVFKFYLQVWVLWGIASAVVLPQIAAWLRGSYAEEKPSIPNMQGRSRRAMAAYKRNRGPQRSTGSLLWWSIFTLLLAACFLYPLTATPVRMNDRFPDSKSTTLDGTAYMQTSIYYDDNRPVVLEQDRQAMEWLRQNVRGIPTIAEASTPLYRWGSRVSIYTGFPSVIGWDWHQKQQRSILPGGIVDSRIQDENAIFTSTDPAQLRRLLDRYGVEYIYVGPLERLYYAGDGINKFDQPSDLWSPVYDKDQVKIFRVRRS